LRAAEAVEQECAPPEPTVWRSRSSVEVCLKIPWQTDAASKRRSQRRAHTYRDYSDLEQLRRRMSELNGAGNKEKELAAALNRIGPRLRVRGRPSGSCANA
jgi:hypothetical protein